MSCILKNLENLFAGAVLEIVSKEYLKVHKNKLCIFQLGSYEPIEKEINFAQLHGAALAVYSDLPVNILDISDLSGKFYAVGQPRPFTFLSNSLRQEVKALMPYHQNCDYFALTDEGQVIGLTVNDFIVPV